MRPSCVWAAVALLCLADGAQGAPDWRVVARTDVEVAYHLLKDNHPGAVPQTADGEFVARLEAAHADALARANRVTGREGVVAILGAFANAMGDGHIRSHAVEPSPTLSWAGLTLAKRGAAWVVAGGDADHASMAGARLLSCDGRSAAALARERLRFIADIAADFSLVNNAGWLLVDDGNPFLQRPAACVFEQAGSPVTAKLAWSGIARSVLVEKYLQPPYGQAGAGVRKAGDGYWIAMQPFNGEAQPVLEAVKAQQEAIRRAPFVVIDLRGNRGGNSRYAEELITRLWGDAYIDAAFKPLEHDSGCGIVYRASPGNIAGFNEAIAHRFKPQNDKAGEALYRSGIAAMEKAAAEGKPLTGEPQCKTQSSLVLPALKPAVQGAVFVVTDSACFSSCLIAVDYLRQFGAIQIGLPTAYNTHYSEVREITLPSGTATFSTLQAIMTGAPPKVGPFQPEKVFADDIRDTAALERWVVNAIAPRR